MKAVFFTILTLLSLAFVAPAQESFYGTTDVKFFREERDKEFRVRASSPLLYQDFLKFQGLNYYAVDENFRIKAKFTKTVDEKYFLMPTSSGRTAKYLKAGILTFKIGDRELTLAAYQNEKVETDAKWREKYGGAYFVPFKDLTNGTETYSGGRYIYLKIPEADETFLDFNLAFNPSCAYGSDEYSCPIPPKENFLQTEIKAGEKIYEHTGKK
ncbi:DUF1684 domain-containing protein [soil metagenome]